jgi:hypothetical protein
MKIITSFQIVFLLFILVPVSIYAQEKLIWVDSEKKEIARSNLDGTVVSILKSTEIVSPSGLSLDLKNAKIYWVDGFTQKIQRSNLDGTEVIEITNGIEDLLGITVDPIQGTIYYSTSELDYEYIGKINFDGTGKKTLISSSLYDPRDIALDLKNGKIYWSDDFYENIRRANLDGTSIEVLIDYPPFNELMCLELDTIHQKIYYVAKGEVLYSDINGNNIDTIISDININARDLAVDLIQDRLYILNLKDYSILVSELDGSNIDTVIFLSAEMPSRISIDPYEQKLYWISRQIYSSDNKIQRANTNGTSIETLLFYDISLSKIKSIATDPRNNDLYFGYSDYITVSDFAGNNEDTLLSSHIDRLSDIALDTINNKIYWTDNSIYLKNADLDGNNFDSIYVYGKSKTGIALDLENEKIYFVDPGDKGSTDLDGKIQCVNFDGSQLKNLVENLNNPDKIAIDFNSGKMYWSEWASGWSTSYYPIKIQKANLDGSEVEDILVRDNDGAVPEGIAIDNDNQRLIWVESDYDYVGHKIGYVKSANFDGSGIKTLVSKLWTPSKIIISKGCQGSEYYINENINLCDGEEFMGYSSSGSYNFNLLTQTGCDSIINVNLVTNNSSSASISPVSCNEYFSPSNKKLTESGIYYDTIPNYVGCDSIIEIDLTIINVDTSIEQSGTTLISNAVDAKYQWLDCDNNLLQIIGATNKSYSPVINGDYAVEINQNGCIDTSSCYEILGLTIIENNFGSSLKIYPNPTNDNIKIELNKTYNDITIRLESPTGQTILVKKYSQVESIEYFIEEKPGLYILEIYSNDSKQAIIKIIKN